MPGLPVARVVVVLFIFYSQVQHDGRLGWCLVKESVLLYLFSSCLDHHRHLRVVVRSILNSNSHTARSSLVRVQVCVRSFGVFGHGAKTAGDVGVGDDVGTS